MNQTIGVPSKSGANTRLQIEHLIALMDELISVVTEENGWLALGLPASRSKQIARKTELAEHFEKCVAAVSAQKSSFQTRDDALRSRFVDRMNVLKTEMDENIVRLQAAIAASQWRIEAVMSAIRQQVAKTPPYTASGRLGSQGASVGTNIRA